MVLALWRLGGPWLVARRAVAKAVSTLAQGRGDARRTTPGDGITISIVGDLRDGSPEAVRTWFTTVMGQDFMSWEVCACEDPGTEEAVSGVLAGWRGSDARLRLVRSDVSLTQAEAIRLAAEQACGDFILLLSVRTVLLPHALRTFADVVRASPDIDAVQERHESVSSAVPAALLIRKALFWRLVGGAADVGGDHGGGVDASDVMARARRVGHVDHVTRRA
jgi:hypothetical protein